MSNTIKIKRRTQGAPGPPESLANGELAYNEVNDVLYYGASEGIQTIGGQGVYVTAGSPALSSSGVMQSVYGNKAFQNVALFQGGILTFNNIPLSASDDSVPTTEWVRQVVNLELNDPVLDAGAF